MQKRSIYYVLNWKLYDRSKRNAQPCPNELKLALASELQFTREI